MIGIIAFVFFLVLFISFAWSIGKDKAQRFLDKDYQQFRHDMKEHKKQIKKLIK